METIPITWGNLGTMQGLVIVTSKINYPIDLNVENMNNMTYMPMLLSLIIKIMNTNGLDMLGQ
jgi:hypothetical protein